MCYNNIITLLFKVVTLLTAILLFPTEIVTGPYLNRTDAIRRHFTLPLNLVWKVTRSRFKSNLLQCSMLQTRKSISTKMSFWVCTTPSVVIFVIKITQHDNVCAKIKTRVNKKFLWWVRINLHLRTVLRTVHHTSGMKAEKVFFFKTLFTSYSAYLQPSSIKAGSTSSVFDMINCPVFARVAWSAMICICEQSRAPPCHIRLNYISKYWSHRWNHELTEASFEELIAIPNTNTLLALNCALNHAVIKITQTLKNWLLDCKYQKTWSISP